MIYLPTDILKYIVNMTDDYSRHYLMRTCKTYAALIPFKYPNFLRLPYYAELYDSESFRVISNKIQLPEICSLWKVEAYVDRGEYEKINMTQDMSIYDHLIYYYERTFIIGTVEMYIAIRYMIKNHIHQYHKIYDVEDVSKLVYEQLNYVSVDPESWGLVSHALHYCNYEFLKWINFEPRDIHLYVDARTVHAIDKITSKFRCVCDILDDYGYNTLYFRSKSGTCKECGGSFNITVNEKFHWCIIHNDIDKLRKLRLKYPTHYIKFSIDYCSNIKYMYESISHYHISDEIILECITGNIELCDVLYVAAVHCSVDVIKIIHRQILTEHNNKYKNTFKVSVWDDSCHYLLGLATLANNLPVIKYLLMDSTDYDDSIELAIEYDRYEALLIMHQYKPSQIVQDIIDNL